MKNKLFSFRGLVFLALLLPIIALFLVYLIYTQSNQGIEETYKDSKKLINEYKESYVYIFTILFDQARSCNEDFVCQKQVSDSIHQKLNPFEEQTPFYSATYFIRLKGTDRLEK